MRLKHTFLLKSKTYLLQNTTRRKKIIILKILREIFSAIVSHFLSRYEYNYIILHT